MFARGRFRGTSLADVAARAGITELGLLHHSGSKAGLLLAMIERRDLDSEAFAMELRGMKPSGRLRALPELARRNKQRAGGQGHRNPRDPLRPADPVAARPRLWTTTAHS
ncbi:TetR/AcrR family transcriptional regulator [Nonomuraea sp. 3-1Str]|uniref:TetR/AcrR family transcriptional regulator n=1 Tax=Nonomuraea sp. 3-1Str TaxID=2929801 RepID=UPI0037CC346E